MARYLIENEDIISTIEGGLGGSFWNYCKEADVDVNVVEGSFGDPVIKVDTGDANIHVRVTTHNIFDDDDNIIGYQFNPKVIIRSTSFDFDQDNVVAEFDKFSTIAKIAQKIYMTEVVFDED